MLETCNDFPFADCCALFSLLENLIPVIFIQYSFINSNRVLKYVLNSPFQLDQFGIVSASLQLLVRVENSI